MVNIIKKLGRGRDWLVENRDSRNYLFYTANLLINPARGAVGLAGKVYESFFNEHYVKYAHVANLARLGLAAVTVLDTFNFDGIVETLGDIALTSALVTDTSYWNKKSLKSVGEDVKILELGKRTKDLSDKINRDK